MLVKPLYDEIIPEWGHMDFEFGIDAGPRVYSTVIKLLRKYK